MEPCLAQKCHISICYSYYWHKRNSFSPHSPRVYQSHRRMVQILVPGRRPKTQTATPTGCTLGNSECKRWHPKQDTEQERTREPPQNRATHLPLRQAASLRVLCQRRGRVGFISCCYCYSRFTHTALAASSGAVYTHLLPGEISAVIETVNEAWF